MTGTFTPGELLEEAERELRMRQRVFPRWVVDGRMTQAAADRKIAMMKAIADILSERLPPPAQGDLLGDGR